MLMLLLLCCLQPAFATPTTPSSDFEAYDDGTVKHKLTGLIWMRCAMGQTWDKATASCTGTAATYTWNAAMALKSDFAGKSDWRLPNIAELQTIVERENYNPAINTIIFPNTPTNVFAQFWSSSRYTGNNFSSWDVYFGEGMVGWDGKGINFFVRLVRGGQWNFGYLPLTTPTTDFIDNGDGTVTHKRTELMWQRCAIGQVWTGLTCSGTAKTYDSYKKVLALTSTFASYNDWRLPNETELLSIVEYGVVSPAINTIIFPNTTDWFWSSSSSLQYSDFAFGVNFSEGTGGKSFKEYNNYNAVRFVRGKPWLFGLLSLDISTESAVSLDFRTRYDAKNAQIIELKNTSANAIEITNVITSDAGSYWVNLFADNKATCHATSYTQTTKNLTIPAKSSCKISIGFSPFDNLTAGKSVAATITLKTVIDGVPTDKIINVTGIGRARVAKACSWGVCQLKRSWPPINATLIGLPYHYASAKYWYGSVIDSTLQKGAPSIGNLVVFAENNTNKAGHVGVVIQTTPVLTMLSMNDIKDSNGVKVRKWSVRPVDWYPGKTAAWKPLITGFNSTDATKHYGFIDWNSMMY
jgi:hypothetical protein